MTLLLLAALLDASEHLIWLPSHWCLSSFALTGAKKIPAAGQPFPTHTDHLEDSGTTWGSGQSSTVDRLFFLGLDNPLPALPRFCSLKCRPRPLWRCWLFPPKHRRGQLSAVT